MTIALRLGAVSLITIALPSLSACAPSVASMDCARIGEEAKTISQKETVKINTLSDLRETSRTPTEARCQGQAVMSDGDSGTMYLRAYEQGGNTMVAYQGTPFP